MNSRFRQSVLLPLLAAFWIASGLARANTQGVFFLLHAFHGAEGASPVAGVAISSAGCLYGTAVTGGRHNHGTVWKIDGSGVFSVLHAFHGTDGANPAAGVTLDREGNLYGTTVEGGAHKV